MTLREVITEGSKILRSNEITDCEIDARLLLEYVFDVSRNELILYGDRNVDDVLCKRYFELIQKRTEHVPLQYLTGTQEFMGLEFLVNENVLIPRQDTECLVEEAMLVTEDGMQVLDMCTGSGCIIISLAKYKNEIDACGVDISEDALLLARKNAEGNQVDVEFVKSNLFENIETSRKFDIVVSNPPYIETSQIEMLMPEVRDYEPRLALDGDEDGLIFYRKITERVVDYLRPGGWLLYEIGCNQGDSVSKILEDKGFLEVSVVKDLAGLPRVVKGRLRCLTS